MAYLVNIKTGYIHDASKSHTNKCSGKHYEKVDTLSEAKAKAIKNGKEPKMCKKCGFASATIAECEI